MYRAITLSLLLCVSCGGGSSTSKSDVTDRPRSVKSVVAISSQVVERDFAGLSTPAMAVNLAFKISGQVLRVNHSKGELVSKGELLCQLDPRDVELQLIADRSSYEQAKSSYKRAERLLSHEAISTQEVERERSNFLTAESRYENTLEILDQTSLRAPFAAVVERVYVDEYQRVQSGESIMRIVTPTTTRVEFTLPESSLSSIMDSLTTFKVRFDNIEGVSFDARVIEYARTSSDAQGLPVTLDIDSSNVEEYYISPGMSCTITMITIQGDSDAVVLPLSAIYSPTQVGEYVWVIGDDDRVELRQVELNRLSGRSSAVVVGGVKSGEEVVSAGVYQLKSGQRVKRIMK